MTQDIHHQHEAYNRKLFKKWASVYDVVVGLVASRADREVVADLINKKKAKVLDVACGTGLQTIAFANRGHEVVGIDLSADMLHQAKKNTPPGAEIAFVHGDASKMLFADSTFDVASISFGLHDMPVEIAIQTLQEIRRTTKPKAQIIIVDYHRPENTFIAFLSIFFIKLYESKYYVDFMRLGLKGLLEAVNLKVQFKETYRLGNFQVVQCINEK